MSHGKYTVSFGVLSVRIFILLFSKLRWTKIIKILYFLFISISWYVPCWPLLCEASLRAAATHCLIYEPAPTSTFSETKLFRPPPTLHIAGMVDCAPPSASLPRPFIPPSRFCFLLSIWTDPDSRASCRGGLPGCHRNGLEDEGVR